MIREANEGDCVNLAALSIQVWLHTYAFDGIREAISRYELDTFSEQYFKRLLEDDNIHIAIFEHEAHLVGFVVVKLNGVYQDPSNGFEIDILYVQEHFQGKGIGRALLEHVKTRLGIRFWLSTWVHNTSAIGFYNKFGFEDIGTIYFELGTEQHENRVLVFKPD